MPRPIVADDAYPVVLPTAVCRGGDRVLTHASTGSRWLRHLAGGAPTCLVVTAFDALVLPIPGRSAGVRASTTKELAAVLVPALPIAEWSLKVSEG